jgi:hypothetical protein
VIDWIAMSHQGSGAGFVANGNPSWFLNHAFDDFRGTAPKIIFEYLLNVVGQLPLFLLLGVGVGDDDGHGRKL